MSSFALILIGLFIASRGSPWPPRGPWPWTGRPGTLIAARRLADDPRTAFRAVSGLVLALFVTTVAVVAITTQNTKNVTRFGTVAESNMVTDQIATEASSGLHLSDVGPAAVAAPLADRCARFLVSREWWCCARTLG